MWISVDRYLAVRKPLRYETVQTRTREYHHRHQQTWRHSFKWIFFNYQGCQCWMCFTWISAAMLCCPSLWTEKEATFDQYAYICVPNWNHMAAYSVTLGNKMFNCCSTCSCTNRLTFFFIARNSRPWSQRHLDSLQLWVHFFNDAKTQKRCGDSW
jgi:hypothetical protein